MSIDFDSYDIFCKGLEEGAIELNIEGGSPEYICIWNTGEAGDNLYNLEEGVYTVTITDEYDCEDSLIVEIRNIDPWADDMELVDENGCGSCTLTDGNNNYFYSDDEYMVYIEDVEDGRDLGDLEICTNLHPFTNYADDNPLLKRSWCINSNGGQAKVRFYFTEEERVDFMTDLGIDFLNQENLFIRSYSGDEGNLESHVNVRIFEDIEMYLLDETRQIWYIEFTIPDMTIGNSCFYLEYLKDESETVISEVREMVNNADYEVNNPVVDYLTLKIDGINVLVNANIYIEDEAQRLVYSKSYKNKRLAEETFKVTDYKAALYYITIEFPKPRVTKTLKFVKVRY